MPSFKESALRQFAAGLNASESYRDEGVRLCEQVRIHLSQRGSAEGITIASTHYGGSIGKHTELKEPDFDIVLMINNRYPPFNQVLKFWEAELRRFAYQLSIDPNSIKLTRFSIQFSFKNGMDVDMLPASANMTPEQALQAIGRDPRMRRFHSSVLVNEQVSFMKDQDSSTHVFVRLVKYWLKSMDLGTKYVSGLSTIFELLAVAAVLEEKMYHSHTKDFNFVNAFNRVLDKVENIDNLKVAFGKSRSGKNWKVNEDVGQLIPYLIEPSNPYNNLLRTIKPETLNIFKQNAKTMRNRFSAWMRDASNVGFNPNKLFPKAN